MSWGVELTSLPQPPQGQLTVSPGVSLSRCRSLAVAPGAAPGEPSICQHDSLRDQRLTSHPCKAGLPSMARGPDPQLAPCHQQMAQLVSWWLPLPVPEQPNPQQPRASWSCSPLSASHSFPHFFLLILSPSVHLSPLLFSPLYS